MDLKPFETISYVALRIIAGLAFSVHGMQKVLGILTEKAQPEIASQMWFGGVIELVAGLMIALGVLTRVGALLASGTMAVAYIQFHWKFQFDDKFFPTGNGGELALIYCFLFLFIAARGGDAVSVDRAMFRKR
jgi:putative oxidoreductase